MAFAGRITAEKGLDVVVDALPRLRETRRIELRIAGAVESPEHWRHCWERAQAAMASRPQLDISHLGHLDAAGVDALFAAADVVVVPSRWPEPLGVVAAEALRAGAVVIASDVGGLDTFVHHGENGLLVAPGDVDAWAAALDRALGELVRRREGRPVDAIAPDTLAAATMDNHLRALEALF